jgi:hypothetical protein
VIEELRGYRKERPLADIIPPDRRRPRAAAILAGGMIAGAALFSFAQQIATKRSPAPNVYSAVIAKNVPSLSIGAATADITSPRAGAIASDGEADQSFDLLVDGAVEAITLASVDSAGRPWGTNRWGTGADLARWQLAVFEDGRPLNRADGGMYPLSERSHRLRLYVSDNGSFEPGSYFRVYVESPGGHVTASAALAFTGHGPRGGRR